MRYLAWALFRKAVLCPGPKECDAAVTITCLVCEHSYKPRDIRMPEACSSCGQVRRYQRDRCGDCQANQLDQRMNSHAGLLLSRAITWDLLLQTHMNITLSDIDFNEYNALEILWDERNKWDKEQQRRAASEQRAAELANRAR